MPKDKQVENVVWDDDVWTDLDEAAPSSPTVAPPAVEPPAVRLGPQPILANGGSTSAAPAVPPSATVIAPAIPAAGKTPPAALSLPASIPLAPARTPPPTTTTVSLTKVDPPPISAGTLSPEVQTRAESPASQASQLPLLKSAPPATSDRPPAPAAAPAKREPTIQPPPLPKPDTGSAETVRQTQSRFLSEVRLPKPPPLPVVGSPTKPKQPTLPTPPPVVAPPSTRDTSPIREPADGLVKLPPRKPPSGISAIFKREGSDITPQAEAAAEATDSAVPPPSPIAPKPSGSPAKLGPAFRPASAKGDEP